MAYRLVANYNSTLSGSFATLVDPLMVNISTLVTYTGVMTYFDNKVMFVGFCMWSVIDSLLSTIVSSVWNRPLPNTMHYPKSQFGLCYWMGGVVYERPYPPRILFPQQSANDCLDVSDDDWCKTRALKAHDAHYCICLLCGFSVIGLDELAYITRG